VHYPPGAFGQSNLDIAEQIIEQVRGHIPVGSPVLELYAGVGAIGLSVIDRVSEIGMNEVSRQALHGLDLGLAGLSAERRVKITVIPGPAGAASEAAAAAQVVIVDPPRKGLDAELREVLSRTPPQRLIYVSCGLESFQEDAAALTAGGGMRLTALQAFNLMPFTEHVETLAVFERSTMPNE